MLVFVSARTVLKWTSLSFLITLITLLSISIRTYRTYDVSSKDIIMNRNDTGLMLYDRHGELFFAFNRARPRIFIPITQIPLHTKQAIIAAEDKGFYSHPGFSLRGMVRSLYLNIKHERITHGGSTITQQLVKNSLLTTKKSITRKFQEVIIAAKIERQFSKDEILEMYANSAYFGEGVFGIEAAAQTYFNKGANELTLGESAILAGLLPAPSTLPPLQRQLTVLEHMRSQRYITAKQRDTAMAEQIVITKREDGLNETAPHFALMVKQELDRIYGEETVIRRGFKVTTTLDLGWQKYAETEVQKYVDSIRSKGAGNGAAVILDPTTGEVRTLVGSVNWWQEKYGKQNMAISPRQTGSAFKPIVYAAGLEEKTITASTILHDTPTTFAGQYKPRDYDNKWRGPVLVRRALANSLNVPAVETIVKTGIPKIVSFAKQLSISTIRDDAQYNLATALGAEPIPLLELVSAYGTFANNGVHTPAILVQSIQDKYNRPVTYEKPEAKKVLDPRVAFIISSILSDNKARAEIFGKLLTISQPAAVKTGTSQDYRDGWTVGYTPNLAGGVWIGNNDNTPMQKLPASIGAAPLWKNLMERYLSELPHEEFVVPEGLSMRYICRSGDLATSRFGATQEYFLPGTEPTRYCAPSASPTPTP